MFPVCIFPTPQTIPWHSTNLHIQIHLFIAPMAVAASELAEPPPSLDLTTTSRDDPATDGFGGEGAAQHHLQPSFSALPPYHIMPPMDSMARSCASTMRNLAPPPLDASIAMIGLDSEELQCPTTVGFDGEVLRNPFCNRLRCPCSSKFCLDGAQ